MLWFQKNMLVFGFNLKLVLKMAKEDVREKIMHKYLQNPNSSYNSIAKSLQIHPYTVSRVIQHFSQTKSINCKSGGGRKEGFKDIKLVRKLVNSFKNNPSLSQRKCAKIYGFSHSFAAKVRNKHGFHSKQKHKKCPTVLKLNKKVQEPAAESCKTILFLKISVLLKTMKLISSTIINKFLVLFILLPNIEEKQIRNLNTQNMTSSLKKL